MVVKVIVQNRKPVWALATLVYIIYCEMVVIYIRKEKEMTCTSQESHRDIQRTNKFGRLVYSNDTFI